MYFRTKINPQNLLYHSCVHSSSRHPAPYLVQVPEEDNKTTLFVLYSGRRVRMLNCPFSFGIAVPLFPELVSLFSRNMQRPALRGQGGSEAPPRFTAARPGKRTPRVAFRSSGRVKSSPWFPGAKTACGNHTRAFHRQVSVSHPFQDVRGTPKREKRRTGHRFSQTTFPAPRGKPGTGLLCRVFSRSRVFPVLCGNKDDP